MQGRNMVWLLALSGMLATSSAQAAVTLQDAVKTAVSNNPEVQARWHTFLSAKSEQDAARGGYFPRVDLTTGIGRDSVTQPNQSSTTLTRRGAVLSFNQMLYDGFSTREEVARLAYAKLVRYYEVLDASETTALETARAYLDVLRYRELSALAEENYLQHEQVFNQIQQRVGAGVGRRVDFEQAGGRLALAQSNMLTEASNLNDVSARYLRLVGELPPDDMEKPALYKEGIPESPEEALKQAYQGSPVFNAAIENVRSAQAEARGRQANFHPRVDLRASKDIGYNDNGISGRREEQVIELVLNYNLFRGGSDQARVRQYAERLKVAKDLRDKACRDVRQTLTIAYNDTESLSRQLGFLDQHQLSIEKAREAYRKQYDIGQRTLLDLLDTENEYFQARRAYANASYDRALAYLRTQAGMGNLLAALQVGRDNLPTLKELGQDRWNVDPDSQCPAVVPVVKVASDILTQRKTEAAPARPLAPPPVAIAQETLPQALAGWTAAWSSRDFPRYRDYYAKSFIPENGVPLTQWSSERAVRLAKPGNITIGIDGLKISNPTADSGVTEFRQTYTSANYRDEVDKRIEWVREGNRWKIQREQVLSMTKATVADLVKPVKKKRNKRIKPAAPACDCK